MRWSMSIGSFGNTAIRLHFTFVLFLLWYVGTYFLQGGMAEALAAGSFLFVLFLSVVLHEFGHIAAAARFGIGTSEILLLPIGGVSALEREPRSGKEELLVAAAGPAVSALLFVAVVGAMGKLPTPAELVGPLSTQRLLGQLAYANLSLLLFNLLPAFPLDGGRVLRAVLSVRLGFDRATQIAAGIGAAAAFVLALIGLTHADAILILIAAFLYLAGRSESEMDQLRALAGDAPASDWMIHHTGGVPVTATLGTAATRLAQAGLRALPVVGASGEFRGVVRADGLAKALRKSGPEGSAEGSVARDIPLCFTDDRLSSALDRLAGGAQEVVVVSADNRPVGLITWDSLIIRMAMARAAAEYAANCEHPLGRSPQPGGSMSAVAS